jgi:quercetin dioxygenase-like cupin family protein
MKARSALTALAVAVGIGAASFAGAQVAITPNEIKWEKSPFSAAELAFIVGHPGKPGPFTLRVRYPAGGKSLPHWHDVDVAVTVLSGTLLFAEGEKFEQAKMKEYPAGSFLIERAKVPHYFLMKTDVVFQASGVGPQGFTYVNPQDDPRKK